MTRAAFAACVALLCLAEPALVPTCPAAAPSLLGLDRSGVVRWTNAPVPAVCTLESAASPAGPWTAVRNAFSTAPAGSATLPTSPALSAFNSGFVRLSALEVPPTAAGFSNLVASYGMLETLAGNGSGQVDGESYWQSWNEGQPAVFAGLSRPHYALADAAGNIYVADKGSHSILRVDLSGNIHTHAGTHSGGFDGEGPAPATQVSLNAPNGLWVRSDGTVYALDTGNGRVRRITPSGTLTTLFLANSSGSELAGGRCLWVSPDESLAYFGNETRIRVWTPAGGVKTLASGFSELGAFHVEASGNLVVCDRGGHRVYRVTPSGTRTVLAGNGTASGGGDGQPALSTGLNGVRGVWPLPTGGWLLLTHDGSQLWYLDTAGIVRLLLDGGGGRSHAGDGLHFYQPGLASISEGRSVSLDPEGNILLCESDWGYIRRIRFLPFPR